LLCCCDIFPNLERAHQVKCPTFIIHGEKDEQVALHHGHRLHHALPKQYQYTPWYVINGGHNNIRQLNYDLYFHKIQNFLIHISSNGTTTTNKNNHDRIDVQEGGIEVGMKKEMDIEMEMLTSIGSSNVAIVGAQCGAEKEMGQSDGKRSAVVHPEM